MKKNYDVRKIKKHYSYITSEICELLKVHPRTVQTWVSKGLEVINPDSKPFLVMGYELERFLKEQRTSRRIKLQQDEFYCNRCKTATKSNTESIKFIDTGLTIGNDSKQVIIKGICQACGIKVNRFSTDKHAKNFKAGD